MTGWAPSQSQLDALRDTIGLVDPDPDDPLHRKLINALVPLGPGSTVGQRIVALRLVINWEHRDAGRRFASAKADYERLLTRRKARLLAEDGMSVARAEVLAEADDDVYQAKLEFLVAQQYERSMRLFLESLDAALDNHRTDRADQRASDVAHAQGLSGGV